MEKGERLQYGCGHWLVAGEFGIQDDSAKDVPTKRCGECQRRLKDAAPQLLVAIQGLIRWLETRPAGIHIEVVPEITEARAAIESAVSDRDAVQ